MNITRLGTVAALALLSASPLAGQGTKVGYVDVRAVLREYEPAQEAQRTVEAAVAGYRTELEQLEADLQEAWTQYQQQQMTMNPEARRAREQELQNKQIAIGERTQELGTRASEREAEVFQPIMDDIRAVLEEIRVEEGYGIILDSNSNAIVVADPALEVTQEVLTRLRARSGSAGEG